MNIESRRLAPADVGGYGSRTKDDDENDYEFKCVFTKAVAVAASVAVCVGEASAISERGRYIEWGGALIY